MKDIWYYDEDMTLTVVFKKGLYVVLWEFPKNFDEIPLEELSDEKYDGYVYGVYESFEEVWDEFVDAGYILKFVTT